MRYKDEPAHYHFWAKKQPELLFQLRLKCFEMAYKPHIKGLQVVHRDRPFPDEARQKARALEREFLRLHWEDMV